MITDLNIGSLRVSNGLHVTYGYLMKNEKGTGVKSIDRRKEVAPASRPISKATIINDKLIIISYKFH